MALNRSDLRAEEMDGWWEKTRFFASPGASILISCVQISPPFYATVLSMRETLIVHLQRREDNQPKNAQPLCMKIIQHRTQISLPSII